MFEWGHSYPDSIWKSKSDHSHEYKVTVSEWTLNSNKTHYLLPDGDNDSHTPLFFDISAAWMANQTKKEMERIRTLFWKKLDADKSDRWRTGCEEKVPKNLNLRKARGSRRRARTKAPRGKARKSDGLRKKLCINRGTSIANFFFRKEEGSLLKEVSSQCLQEEILCSRDVSFHISTPR